MLYVDHERWGQTAADLRQLALHEIAQGSCATEVAEQTGRRPHTVMAWLHAYNEHGPAALAYRRTGGRPPFAPTSRPASARLSAPPSAPPRRRP